MRQLLRLALPFFAVGHVVFLPSTRASAEDTGNKTANKTVHSNASTKMETSSPVKETRDLPELDLLDAMRKGTVSVKAEGSGDGRMIVSVTNRTNRPLRVVLPPGIIAQGAAGQIGGMGGMGMGGMGGGGMGGMGGGTGGMGGGTRGGMGGMGGMGRTSGTLPPTMGMMMLANIIMYFTGDFDSWDRRSLMIGMGRMGGMGGMGMGGMGGGMMGGMGGGMRSVPPSGLPFAELKPGQTRHLPTR